LGLLALFAAAHILGGLSYPIIWHADGRFTRLEGAPCKDYAAALAASLRLRSE
jgi:hypothetical protein